jgi:7-carboxy-7-deazaguanine synthase
LRITEIFFSLQGESLSVGQPTVFVRLTGCPLRCTYCDTEYAFSGGDGMSLQDVLSQVAGYATRYVCVTGGEPLAQKNCLLLLNELADRGYHVSLETSGAMDVKAVDSRVTKVMDMKTPTSGESGRNLEGNIQYLAGQDQVKFVLCNRDDYDWAKQQIKQWRLTASCEVLFSASYSQLEPSQLADWILEDQLQVRFQLQIHKILWGEQKGR